MPLPLLMLALSAFGIGTTEFVIMGLLQDVADGLNVSIPAAGWLVTGYALGVAFGAPFMALGTSRLPRRFALILLMSIFIVGNLLCAVASDYHFLMIARVVTALCHGAFFGIGSVVAATLVAPERKAQAVALMFTGLTLANVLGVPLGTAIGHAYGWQTTFWAVTALGILALAGLIYALPHDPDHQPIPIRQELNGLKTPLLWVALSLTVLFAAAMFALFTYISPLLLEVTHLAPDGITWTLLLMGVGLTLGNLVGGRWADRHLSGTLMVTFIAMTVLAVLFYYGSPHLLTAEVTIILWAIACFAAVPALQVNVVRFGQDAPTLVSTLNISAFNVGNALGAWAGGMAIDTGFGVASVSLVAAALSLIALFVTLGLHVKAPHTGAPSVQ